MDLGCNSIILSSLLLFKKFVMNQNIYAAGQTKFILQCGL